MENTFSQHCALLVDQAKKDAIDQLAVGTVIVRDGKVLIVIRAADEDIFPDHAEIPGGSVEQGENILDAVVRETKEETGLDIIETPDFFGSFDYVLPDGRNVRQFNFFVESKTSDVRLNPKEHSSYFWLDPKNLAMLGAVKITPLMKKTILEAIDRL